MARVSVHALDPSHAGVETVETHVSTLVFDGERVHKRKKPVRFPFIDLSTRELRRQACERDVALNRRFSPDVYLGVEDVVDDAGNVVDYAVLMRRLPADRRLATLIRERRDVSPCLRTVARTMADHHARAASTEEVRSVATPQALHELWAENLRELAAFVPQPIDRAMLASIGQLAHRYLDGRAALLAERVSDGRVVDGHGDLLAEDIFCLDDGPRILDGLEFDDRLRWGDVLYDVGFLAMDLERVGRLDLATAFLKWYREFSAETHPSSLEHHYVAYRALVRSKVSCLRGGPGDLVDAGMYLTMCHRHLLDARVRVVVIGGLPGSGKSTLAAALGDELGWPVLRSDEVRKELAGLDPLDPAPAAYQHGLYSPVRTEATYEALNTQAKKLMARGHSVILDASFSKASLRARAAAIAAECSADLVEVRCVLPADVAAARVSARAATGGDPSDANDVVVAEMAASFDCWPGATTVSTSQPVAEIVPVVLDRISSPADPAVPAPATPTSRITSNGEP